MCCPLYVMALTFLSSIQIKNNIRHRLGPTVTR